MKTETIFRVWVWALGATLIFGITYNIITQ